MLKSQRIFFCLLLALIFNTFHAKAQSCIELYGINFENNVVIPVNLDPATAVFDTVTKISNNLNPLSFRRGGLAVAPSDRKLYFIVELNFNNVLNIREISFTNNQIDDPNVTKALSEIQYDCNDSNLFGVLNNGGSIQFVSVNDDGTTANIGSAINLNPNTVLAQGISTIDSEQNRYFFAVFNTISMGYTIYVVETDTGNINSFDVPLPLVDLEFNPTTDLLMAFTTAYDIVSINPITGVIESTVPTNSPGGSLTITAGNTAYDPFENVLYVAAQSTVNGDHFLFAHDVVTGFAPVPSKLAGEVFDLTAGIPCIAIPDFTFENTCQGEETIFIDNSIGAISWTWDFGDPASGAANTSTEESPTHIFSAPGDYNVTLNIAGCIASESISKVVTISQAPAVDLGGTITTCESSIVLTAPSYPNATYLWITGSGAESITVTQSRDDYWVEISIGTCVVRDTVAVTLGEGDTGSFSIQGADQTSYCEGETVTLDASIVGSSAVYAWSTLETTPTIEVTASGTYSVVVTQNDCIFNDEVIITFNAPPNVTIDQSGEICEESTTLTATDIAGATYLWSNGDTTPFTTVSSSGDYSVVVNTGGCEVTASTSITLIGNIEIDLGANANDEIFACASEPLVLNAGIGNSNATFLWSDGVTTDSLFTVPNDGTYSVEVSLGNTCTASKSVDVTFTNDFFVDLGEDETICAGESVTLRTGLAGAEHEWSTGETTEEITVNASGTYSVTVRSGACEADGSITISVENPTAISLGEERSLCTDTGDAITLSIDNPGLTFEWSTGNITSQITVTTPGTYQVIATNAAGCTSSATVSVIARCESALVVPTAFSPNNDNVNDVFLPSSRFINDYQFEVYNRWGKSVFLTTDPNEGWDGEVDFQPQPLGVYIYVVTYTDVDGLPVVDKGYFTLLR
ncbi:MAG: gliding motility-associated C-terminal domain-containing protein [Chitinophagales bacterium]